MRIYRQGDVLIREISEIPDGDRTDEKPVKGRYILAEGEATGHAHAVRAVGVALAVIAARRILQVQAEAQVVHEEHHAITLPPGNYEVIGQHEYRPQGTQRVED
jgi:hypothetical protein